MSQPERGLPILTRTLCRVGSHVWITAGASATGPEVGQQCSCGLVAWRDRKEDAA